MPEPEISFSAHLGEVFAGKHREPRMAAFLEAQAERRAAERAEYYARHELVKATRDQELREGFGEVRALIADLRALQALL